MTEETGLCDLIMHGSLGTIDWYFQFRGKKIHKSCHFFLFEAPTGTTCPQAEEGIVDCKWFSHAEALKTISYENARNVLSQAGSIVTGLFESPT